jgi:hypothetical protein
MFFVSEEFLRRHAAGEEVRSTLGEVVAPGETLFPQEKAHKAEMRDSAKAKRQEGGAGT